MPLNYTLKNGFNDQFYVMCILSQHKKVQIYKWDQRGTPQIETSHPLNHFVWPIPMYRLRTSLFLTTRTPWMSSTLKEGTINSQSWNPDFLNTVFRSHSSQKSTRGKTSAILALICGLWKPICPSLPLCEPLLPCFLWSLSSVKGHFSLREVQVSQNPHSHC